MTGNTDKETTNAKNQLDSKLKHDFHTYAGTLYDPVTFRHTLKFEIPMTFSRRTDALRIYYQFRDFAQIMFYNCLNAIKKCVQAYFQKICNINTKTSELYGYFSTSQK